MPEWRKDPVLNCWVVIATQRSKRPSDFKVIQEEKEGNSCPLCPGHEYQTPPEVMAFRNPGTLPDTPGWSVRIVPNKFPAVDKEARPSSFRQGIYEVMNGFGVHEVVVETPAHVPNLDVEEESRVEEVIRAWRERYLKLRLDSRIKYIQVFKNFGQIAGASLEHSHSQIVAIPMVPIDVQMELEGARKYEKATGGCVFCDIIHQELEEKQRLVTENKSFIGFAPFASRFPFETWIIPRDHEHDFGNITEGQIKDLARVFSTMLRTLSLTLGHAPYNMVLHTVPVNEPESKFYHWHMEILPRLTILAGFELGTGYYINPTPPELAAQFLRKKINVSLEHNEEVTDKYVRSTP